MWRVPFGDLRISDTARHYLQRALDMNWVSEGENVREFERRFAERFGYKHAIATSSGTDACMCACAVLLEAGAKRGDEVIIPACTFVATANAVLAAGLVPKFVDIELETLNINRLLIEAAVNERTAAIMPVHLMGKPAAMGEVLAIAERHRLWVVEDACEAHGAQYKGKYVGTLGDMGAFSFYAAHLIVCGEGGMVVTNSHRLADTLRSVRSHGRPPGSIYFAFERVGFNSRMNDMEAAIGLGELERFDETFQKRRDNLKKLLEMTRELQEHCYFIKEEPHEVVSPHAFPLVLKDKRWDRDKLYHYLEEKGIQCKTLFGSLPTQHGAFRFLGHKPGDFPVAEYVGENGLHFGIHQYLTEDDLVYISETLKGYFKEER